MQGTHSLMSGILDYAGLFPPAALDMPAAVRNYARYRAGADHWMLSRLVLPVARFAEFEREAAALLPRNRDLPHPDSWPITALVAGADDPALDRDLAIIEGFNERHAARDEGGALVDSIELKAGSPAGLEKALDLVPANIFPYFELPWNQDVRGAVTALADMDAGAKIRTGGTDAAAHPPPEAVARFLLACRAAKVPFKATAGLHHPVRHHAASVGALQFGFLNVFVGACLLWHRAIDDADLVQVLSEEQAASFELTPSGVGWRGRRLTLHQVTEARSLFAHAFGSCSFDEPLADLRSAGSLGAAA